jgi:hypothetical protein
MTVLPIPISIGSLAADAVREVRFSSAVDCRLGRLHVERARPWTADEAATVVVLHDTELLLAEGETAELLASYDRLLEQLGDRPWTATREVAIELLLIAGRQAVSDNELPAILFDPGDNQRMALPFGSGTTAIAPGQSAQITTRPQTIAFVPERLRIGGDASRWLVNDISIGNRSQLAQAGDLPGELFATNAIDTFISFETVQTSMDVRLVVTYVGPNPDGEPFQAAMVGRGVDIGAPRGIELPAGKNVKLRIRNTGAAGEFRAVWLATERPKSEYVEA